MAWSLSSDTSLTGDSLRWSWRESGRRSRVLLRTSCRCSRRGPCTWGTWSSCWRPRRCACCCCRRCSCRSYCCCSRRTRRFGCSRRPGRRGPILQKKKMNVRFLLSHMHAFSFSLLQADKCKKFTMSSFPFLAWFLRGYDRPWMRNWTITSSKQKTQLWTEISQNCTVKRREKRRKEEEEIGNRKEIRKGKEGRNWEDF